MLHWFVSWIVGEYTIYSSFFPAYLNFISYRQLPTFGSDTIRQFSANASEMKKMAARDYEDLLQVVKLIYFCIQILLKFDHLVFYSCI